MNISPRAIHHWSQNDRLNKSDTQIAFFILRLGLAIVFLWFGIDKFIHMSNWIGWVPDWMQAMIPFSVTAFMYIQGVVETLAGFFLLMGIYPRLAALVCALILIGIEITLFGTGQIEMMIRDGGLLAASISLFFLGAQRDTFIQDRHEGTVKHERH